MIDYERVLRLRDKRERVDSEKAARAAGREKKMQGIAEKLAARNKSKGNEIEVINLGEDLEEFHLSEGDGYETVDAEVGDTSGVKGGGGGFICRYRRYPGHKE